MLLLVKTGAGDSIELTAEDLKELKDLAAKASLGQILKAVKRFGQLEIGLDNYSTLPLELAMVDSTLPATEEKEAPAHPAEPEPAARKTALKTIAPPPRQKVTTLPIEKKPIEPAPAEPVAAERPAAATTAKAEAGPLAAGSVIEQLQAQWNRIIKEAPDNLGKTPAAALLRSARPLKIEDDTIVVSFKYPYHKEKMDNIDNQKTADKIVSSFLGRACRVRCVYEHENNHLVREALKMGAQVIDAEEK